MTEGPLRGILVVEFGNLIAAPYATMMLADLGARVVKVETPSGDLGRHYRPFQNGESVFFMALNRGKESLALDTKDISSRKVLEKLLQKSDVLIHNLRQGAMERIGFGDERAFQLNPHLIYASVSAFGSEGPYAERAGIDLVFQGEAGMISITGDPDDGPKKTATTIGDYVAGTNAALAIAAALAERPRRKRRIDISLRDGVIAVQSGWNALAFSSGSQPARTGTASPYVAPSQVFDAADRPFTLAIVSDRHFQLLCEALERPDLGKDYPTNEDRMADRGGLTSRLSRIFGDQSADHWVEILQRAGLPVGHVLTIEESLNDPQARHNQMTVEFDHPVAGRVKTTGSPIHLDHSPARASSIPATLGEHTAPILRELGLDPETVEQMVESGTAVVPRSH